MVMRKLGYLGLTGFLVLSLASVAEASANESFKHLSFHWRNALIPE